MPLRLKLCYSGIQGVFAIFRLEETCIGFFVPLEQPFLHHGNFFRPPGGKVFLLNRLPKFPLDIRCCVNDNFPKSLVR